MKKKVKRLLLIVVAIILSTFHCIEALAGITLIVTDRVPSGNTLGMVSLALEGKQCGQICGKQSAYDEPTINMEADTGIELKSYATYTYRDVYNYEVLRGNEEKNKIITDRESAMAYIESLKRGESENEKGVNPGEKFLSSLTDADYKKYDIIAYGYYDYSTVHFVALDTITESDGVLTVNVNIVNPILFIYEKYKENIIWFGNLGFTYNFILIPKGEIIDTTDEIVINTNSIVDSEKSDMFYPMPDLSEYFEDEGNDKQPVKEILLGDITGDKKINAEDALIVLKKAALVETIQDTDLLYADVNEDGKLNAWDALKILQYASNIITKL